MSDDRLRAGFESSIRRATHAFEKGDSAAATLEAVSAASFSWAIFRTIQETEPDRYRIAWEELARTLQRLPPTALRRSLEIQGQL